jgi:hypothetical protein
MLTPHPASSRALARGRWQVEICQPIGPGRSRVVRTARFPLAERLEEVLEWTAANTPADQRATIGYLSPRDGWTGHHAGRYVPGEGWLPLAGPAAVQVLGAGR